MISMSSVTVQNVSLRYITGDIKNIGLKEYVFKKAQGKYYEKHFWANRNISFSIRDGDMLGIIGKNGAGKSTLLKVISGVLEPTEGNVKTEGTIAALLELSAGFDGNLTVRENTYLRGALLGYTKAFMDQMYESIIAFAELQEFQYRQFNQLSSGMKSRLAFSIACLVNPDILILDEVLSVGDGSFREKSGNKMQEILNNGVTGLLVSHSVSQVRELCNKVLWLDQGKQIIFSDDVEKTCNAYEEYLKIGTLPETLKDFTIMSDAWIIRQQKVEQKKMENRKRAIIQEIESTHSEAALAAALEIIRKRDPNLIKQDM